MSRISKWKLEKTKVKVVFRLQFHATHIPQSGWEKLFISCIPADTGKPTAKTTKANVRNGSCKWGDPIYETTRLLQDSKSKQYDEKLYKLVVAMGSSRSSVLGEATINLADYVDASKPIIASCPLHGCNFGTVLHITVQLLTSKTGFREFEQQRELREKGLQSGVDNHGDSASGRISSLEGVTSDQTDKVGPRIKFKADASEISSLEEDVIDGSSNTSGSLYAEKHETSCTSEIDSVKCTISGDLYELPHTQSPYSAKEDLSDHQNIAQGSAGSAQGWSSNNSIDNELATACQENNRLRGSLELAESSLFNIKLEVSSLQGVADELGAETEKLSHELTAEISSAEELAKEVLSMKSECLMLKDEIIKLKDIKLSAHIPFTEASNDRVDRAVRKMQLQFSNGISLVEDKLRDLQKKTYAVPHDGDTQFINLELEALLGFLLDFKLRNGEMTALSNSLPLERSDGFGLDLCPPETVLQHFSSSPPVSDAVNPLGPSEAMKAQIFDLVRELDEAKVEKESLTRKMDQMELYYEALIHELEVNQKRLLGEMQLLRNEHSTCLYALTVSKTEVESLHEEANQKMLRFVDERRDLVAINEELERRASTSEAALRRARLNYSIAVEKLQKDLELLSSQVTSMFDANESLIKQALPSQPDPQAGLKLLQNPGDDDATKLTQLQNQNSGLKKRSAGGDVLLEDLKRSVCMQEDLYRKVEEELVEMHSINLNLDIYSKALEQSLCEANADFKIMNEKMSELVEELKSSSASQNHLMLQLQKAREEIHSLDEFKSSSISQCSEMALQNQLLEDKLVSVSKKNDLLAEKLVDWESKYAASLTANAELSLQLKQEAFENEKLMNETSRLKEESKILRAESDELVSSKRNIDESIKFVEDKLANLLFSYNKQFGSLAGSRSLDLEIGDIKDAVVQLEELQHSALMDNVRLMEENHNLKSEKASADVSLSSVRSEIVSMKQKFKSSIQDMATKLDFSNALVDRLQAGIELVANKLHLNSEIEEKYVEQNEVLLADLALFEDQMQKLACGNGHLARDISNLDSLAEELGRSKLEINELIRDKRELAVRLTDRSEESMKLSIEVSSLKEDLKTLHNELHDGKASTDELEQKVKDLTRCLIKNQEERLEFEQEKAGLERKVQDLTLSLTKDQNKLLEFEQQKAELERKVQDLTLCSSKGQEKLLELEQQKAELDRKIEDLTLSLSKGHEEQLEFEHQKAELERKVQDLTLCTSKDQEKLLELEQEKAELELKVQDLTRRLSKDQEERLEVEQEKSELEQRVQDLTLCSSKGQEKLLEFEQQKAELEQRVQDLTFCSSNGQEKLLEFEQQKAELERKVQELTHCLSKDQEGRLEFEQQKAELERKVQDLTLCSSKDQEKLLELELHTAELEQKVQDLTLCSSKDQENLLEFEQQRVELVQIRELASHLELEKSRLSHLLHQQNELVEELKKNSSYRENQLSDIHVHSLAADLKVIYISSQYETLLKELQKFSSSEVQLRDLQKKYQNTESKLNHSLAGEANWRQEKENLVAVLESLRSDLEASESKNKLLNESNNGTRDQLEECKREMRMMENRFSLDSSRQASEVLRLQHMITDMEEEKSNLILSKEELEFLVIVLKGKVDEQTAHISLLEGYKNELEILRTQFNELSHKLAEQVLKTEEFKNLSVHLKELKDKAESECVAAREKRENEVPSVTVQDSLRVAFIKEQYETKNQELKQQLSMSKKHGEEMLIRLQDAIDEIENRKKSEAVSLKRNEELSTRLSALEAELQSLISEKREKSNAYDRIKAELECALLSLECCKEEKEKLGASLLEFEGQKSHLADELALIKGQLEDLKCSTNLEKGEYGSEPEVELAQTVSTGDASPPVSLKWDNSSYGIQRELVLNRDDAVPNEPVLTTDSESADSSEALQLHSLQDAAPYLQSNGKTLDVSNEHLGAQRLRSSIEHLHEELEKMKNENAIFNMEHDADPDFQDTQREIMQLHKANEELRSMFPLFDEISSGGNALDRVLALEFELADALKMKNKSNTLFQSSFLKQHSDEEAVFKSFRDINELIKEMLELKGRHAGVEAELREMHDRYSRLSLQFAEVEGERQKLKMTLKNVRSSRG